MSHSCRVTVGQLEIPNQLVTAQHSNPEQHLLIGSTPPSFQTFPYVIELEPQTQNHRMVWFEATSKITSFRSPDMGRDTFHRPGLPRAQTLTLRTFSCVGERSDGLNTFFFKVFLCHGFYLRCCHVGAESQEGEKIICSA